MIRMNSAKCCSSSEDTLEEGHISEIQIDLLDSLYHLSPSPDTKSESYDHCEYVRCEGPCKKVLKENKMCYFGECGHTLCEDCITKAKKIYNNLKTCENEYFCPLSPCLLRQKIKLVSCYVKRSKYNYHLSQIIKDHLPLEIYYLNMKIDKVMKKGNTCRCNSTIIDNDDIIQILELPLPEYIPDDSYSMDLFTAASVDFYTFRDLIKKAEFNSKHAITPYKYEDQKNYAGWTPLLYASYLNQTEIISFLMRMEVNPNISNNKKETPMMLASACGHENVVKILLDNKGDPNLQSEFGKTALIYATLHNQLSCIYVLLENNANPNIADDTGNTATLYACRCGNENILRLMLQYGGNPFCVNKAGENGENLIEGNTSMQEMINDVKVVKDAFGSLNTNIKYNGRVPHVTPKGKIVENPADVLEMLKLDHYIDNFVKYNINLKMFFHLSEVDLIHIGVDNQIARSKILGIINSFPTNRILACDPKASLKYQALLAKYKMNEKEKRTVCEKQIAAAKNDCEEAEADISGLNYDIQKFSIIDDSLAARHKNISRCVFSLYKHLNSMSNGKHSQKAGKAKEAINTFLRKYNALITNRLFPATEAKK
uniref:NAD(+) ADP-ribosyltransferase n=1 Tax=Parastrongyloides trichosuri TaxID=131310 RepID=A0A0N4Z166_PARTI